METKKKHKFLDYSEVDPALENRKRFKYRVEVPQTEAHYHELRALGEWKRRTPSCGVVFTKLRLEDLKKEVMRILDCTEDVLKISDLSVDLTSGYTLSKFL